jgi:CheY-like chemotaxis protein
MNAKLDAEDHEHASLVNKSANALLHLLNDILDFSKIEAGSMDVVPQMTRFPDVLQECVSLLEPAARTKGVAIFLHVHADVPPCALVDGLRLRQIALNLLGNAVKFTEKGFVALEATLSSTNGNESLLVIIHDTGVGIPADRQQAIFGEFVQANPTVAGRFGGTGLGLSISRRLAELMGGSLALESEVGRGTKVSLAVPIVRVSEGHVADVILTARSVVTAARILLVEDDLLNQRLATTIIHRLGHQVEIAADGLEAVEKMRSFELNQCEFDIVLMDIQLPEIDGMEATREIRKLGPRANKVPIIALSANAYSTDVAACLDAGMNDHVPKPFSINSLSLAISKWCSPSSDGAASGTRTNDLSDLEAMFLEQCKSTSRLVSTLQIAYNLRSKQQISELALRVRQESHKIAGTAATFGRGDLGKVAAATEEYFLDATSVHDLESAKMIATAFQAALSEALEASRSIAA